MTTPALPSQTSLQTASGALVSVGSGSGKTASTGDAALFQALFQGMPDATPTEEESLVVELDADGMRILPPELDLITPEDLIAMQSDKIPSGLPLPIAGPEFTQLADDQSTQGATKATEAHFEDGLVGQAQATAMYAIDAKSTGTTVSQVLPMPTTANADTAPVSTLPPSTSDLKTVAQIQADRILPTKSLADPSSALSNQAQPDAEAPDLSKVPTVSTIEPATAPATAAAKVVENAPLVAAQILQKTQAESTAPEPADAEVAPMAMEILRAVKGQAQPGPAVTPANVTLSEPLDAASETQSDDPFKILAKQDLDSEKPAQMAGMADLKAPAPGAVAQIAVEPATDTMIQASLAAPTELETATPIAPQSSLNAPTTLMQRQLAMTDANWPAALTSMMEEARDLTQGEIEIALQPARLGKMTVRLQMAENTVSVNIVTENEAAAQMFNEQQGRLSDMMTRAGLELTQHNANSSQSFARDMGQHMQQNAQGQTGQGGSGSGGNGTGQDRNDGTQAQQQFAGSDGTPKTNSADDTGVDILA